MLDLFRARVVMILWFGLLLVSGPVFATSQTQGQPRVFFNTSDGHFVVELYPDKAPETVKNFLRYVREGFYDGTIFHRVIPGFVIQGGGYTTKFLQKPTHPPINNEAGNGLRNERGTIAMARTRDPNSATSQFFINLADNETLNRNPASVAGAGYAVFGKVVQGMGVINDIASSPTGPAGPFVQDVPLPPVVILNAHVLQGGSTTTPSQAQ